MIFIAKVIFKSVMSDGFTEYSRLMFLVVIMRLRMGYELVTENVLSLGLLTGWLRVLGLFLRRLILEAENLWIHERFGRWITDMDDMVGVSKINSCQNGFLLSRNVHGESDQYFVSVNPDEG